LGFDVVAMDDLSGGFRENVPAGATWFQGDVTDVDCVKRLWQTHGPFRYVYHLAAYAAEGLSHFIRRFNYQNNLLGSINLLNQSVEHATECFVFTSSIAVYGRNQLPMSEDLTPSPEDPYGISKFAVELDLAAAHRMFGLDYVIFRPHNVYGERQNIADKYRNVVGIFMNQLLQDQPMTLFGDGMQTRAFSHVSDVAPLIAKGPLVPEARNQVFNVGADSHCTVMELAQVVAEEMGKPFNVRHLPERNEVVNAFADHSKISTVFAPPPPKDLRDGIRLMADWVRRHGPAKPVEFKNIEVRKGLPAAWAATA
jgi:UDP-glucose 4-epimerase